MPVHRLAVTRQNNCKRSSTVFRVKHMNRAVGLGRHPHVFAHLARPSLYLHVGARRLQNRPRAFFSGSVAPRIAPQVLLLHTRFVVHGPPILHHGRHLWWKPGPGDSLGHLPKTCFHVQRMHVSRGRSQRSRQTSHRHCNCLSHVALLTGLNPRRYRDIQKSQPSPTLACGTLRREDTIIPVSPEVSHLLKRARSLPADERAALANTLLDSLDHPDDSVEVKEAWEKEVARRMRDLDAGRAVTVPWEELRLQLLATLNER